MENKKVRFAVVGVHSIARHHIDGIQKLPYAELAAICDIHEEFAVDCAKVFGIERVYTDYKDMLAAGYSTVFEAVGLEAGKVTPKMFFES